jgi:ferrous iron transport protein A
MPENKSLVELNQGREGVIVTIHGGQTLCRRLKDMCIAPGARIRKISGSLLRGPVTVQIGNARAALGFGMAEKIVVKADESVEQ